MCATLARYESNDACSSRTASFDSYRASVAHIQNRAVFEIPEVLAKILERGDLR